MKRSRWARPIVLITVLSGVGLVSWSSEGASAPPTCKVPTGDVLVATQKQADGLLETTQIFDDNCKVQRSAIHTGKAKVLAVTVTTMPDGRRRAEAGVKTEDLTYAEVQDRIKEFEAFDAADPRPLEVQLDEIGHHAREPLAEAETLAQVVNESAGVSDPDPALINGTVVAEVVDAPADGSMPEPEVEAPAMKPIAAVRPAAVIRPATHTGGSNLGSIYDFGCVDFNPGSGAVDLCWNRHDAHEPACGNLCWHSIDTATSNGYNSSDAIEKAFITTHYNPDAWVIDMTPDQLYQKDDEASCSNLSLGFNVGAVAFSVSSPVCPMKNYPRIPRENHWRQSFWECYDNSCDAGSLSEQFHHKLTTAVRIPIFNDGDHWISYGAWL